MQDDLEVRKKQIADLEKEVADLDNLRIERDGIVKQISDKNGELSEITIKVEDAHNALTFAKAKVYDAQQNAIVIRNKSTEDFMRGDYYSSSHRTAQRR
jgi:predicted  nucleic acid-binding Zn-ribbon protein